MQDLNSDMLKAVFTKTTAAKVEQFYEPLVSTMNKYDINTPERIAMFLAQIGHESGELTAIEENLNYRPERLQVVFPKYFSGVDVNAYGRNPAKIANRVYANRMGNGNEASGDGYKYRGRGLIQLTGKNNYQKFATSLDMTLDECVNYLSTIEGACDSAGWFWDSNNLNEPSDAEDIVTVTKKINGGLNGLDHRTLLYNEFISLLR